MTMELVFVAVLAIVSLVSATPYGYGVKGGAAAKADASAVAGSGGFGAIPLSIPSGSGSYSGSFSKSSASSYASSSSSSGSFSFNGGTPGSNANGVIGSTKCTSGSCLTANYGPSSTGFTGANAAAVAGAAATAFPKTHGGYNTGCNGGDCSSKPGCEGSDCGDSDSKCTSGDCEKPGVTPTYGYNSNDIFLSVSGSKSNGAESACNSGICGTSTSLDNKPKAPSVVDAYPSATASIDKPSTSLTAPKEEPCTSPNCGSATSDSYSKEKPSSYNVPTNTVYSQSQSHCNAGTCDSKLPNSPPERKPEASNDCKTDNCGATNIIPPVSDGYYPDFVPLGSKTGSFSTSGAQIPSTIQPSYSDSAPKNTPFANVASVTGVNSFSSNYGAIKPSQKLPYHGGFGGPPGILKPNEFGIPALPQNNNPTASYNPSSSGSNKPSCLNGYCGLQPQSQISTSSSPQHGQSGSYKPTGPAGLTAPARPTGSAGPTAPAVPTRPAGPTGSVGPASYYPSGSSNPASCTLGNCVSQPNQATPQSGQSSSYKPVSSYHPSGPTSLQNQPGCSSGNCGIQESQPSQSTPQYIQNDAYKHFGPTGSYNPVSTGSYSSTSCSFGNCGTQPNQLTPQPSQSDSYPPTGSYKPTGPSESSNPVACTSGKCGTQSAFEQDGSYKPSNNPSGASESYGPASCFSGKCGTQPSKLPVQFGPGESQYKPAVPTSPHACSPGTCGATSPQLPPSAPHAPSFDDSKPSSPSSDYNPTGCYSGNCGSQSGQSAPTYEQNSSYKPSGAVGSYNPSGSYTPTECTYGNCGSQSSQFTPEYEQNGSYKPTGSYNPTNTGSYGPSGCSSGNCGAQPTPSLPPLAQGGSYKPSGHHNPTYSPSNPSYNPTSCSSGNCGSNPGQIAPQLNSSGAQYKPNAPGFGGPAGILKPNEFIKPIPPTNQAGGGVFTASGSYNPSCSFGNCAPQPEYSTSQHGQSSPAAAASAASANAVVYTGGFGGPPGFLQPYDGKLPAGVSGKVTHIGSAEGVPGAFVHSSYGKSLNGANTGSYTGSNTQALAGAVAGGGGASIGDNSHSTGGCKGGCGFSSGGYNGAAAKSVASAVNNASAGAYSSSYASSSASAHASAGTATKGGYGKR